MDIKKCLTNPAASLDGATRTFTPILDCPLAANVSLDQDVLITALFQA